MKRIIKDYFTFSKKERRAVIILLLMIAVFIAAPYFYSPRFKPPVVNKALTEYLSRSKPIQPGEDHTEENLPSFYSSAEAGKIAKHETFAFDPNSATENDWMRLGISDRTTRIILNYRNKGGKFRTAEDLRKIWGIRK